MLIIADNIEQYNASPSPATSLGITSEVTPLILNFIFFGRRHHMSSYYMIVSCLFSFRVVEPVPSHDSHVSLIRRPIFLVPESSHSARRKEYHKVQAYDTVVRAVVLRLRVMSKIHLSSPSQFIIIS